MHVHSANPRACFSMLSSRGSGDMPPQKTFREFGVNLDQKLLD